MLRRVAVGTVGVVTLVPVIGAASPTVTPENPAKPPPMRPSELPIYDAPHAEYAEQVDTKQSKQGYLSSLLLTPVTAVREKAQTAVEHTGLAVNIVKDNFQEFQDRTDWIVQYLREEENKQMRYGAVAMGGLTGFIFGLRGGFIRRIIYAGAGTTGMGLICFPEETKQILSENKALAKQYINIAYNFLYGGYDEADD